VTPSDEKNYVSKIKEDSLFWDDDGKDNQLVTKLESLKTNDELSLFDDEFVDNHSFQQQQQQQQIEEKR